MRTLFLMATLLVVSITAEAEHLLPTAAGTTWEYDVTESLTGVEPINAKITIRAGTQMLYGVELVKLETLSPNRPSRFELVNVDEESIICLARSGKDGEVIKSNPPESIIVTPLRSGAAWDSNSEVEGIKMHQHFTVVGEEDITVPAGKFRAFHLHSEGASLISVKLDQWFVPGTGFVKEMIVLRGPGLIQRIVRQLTKLTPSNTKIPSEQGQGSTPGPTELTPPPTPPGTQLTVGGDSPAPPKKLTVEVSSDPAGGLTTEFKSTVPHIYVRWHGRDLPEGARVKVTWVAEDVGDLVEPNFVVDETETIASKPDASARFTLARPPDGWAVGKYRVEFYINDVLTETVNVTIK